jgi:hypothetical protein
LYFTPSYNLSSIISTGSITKIKNEQPISNNTIKIDKDINDTFVLKPYPDINGLYTTSGAYSIPVVIPAGTYTRNRLYSKINEIFLRNPISARSSVTFKKIGNDEHTHFLINIYKVFTTKDYSLVFYDPFSFATCNSSGANKNIQNVKWDSTLGWILGFRAQPVYYLDEYSMPNPTIPPNVYLTINNNLYSLEGDTCLSLSLFNYFMIILDDFNQNRINDGLITTSPQEENTDLGLNNTYVCDPVTGKKVLSVVGNTEGKTANQIYAIQQKYLAKQVKARPYSTAASIKDIFALIPISTAKFEAGDMISETGGTLQKETRLYFGPVNIRRLAVKLVNEKGDLVNLNGSNWTFGIQAIMLTDMPRRTNGQQASSGATA